MAKGGNFENLVSRELSLLWSNGERNDLIRRSEMSGGRFTSKKSRGEDATETQAGDITFSNDLIKPLFNYYSIEIKIGYSRKSKTDSGLKVVNWCILDVIDSKQKDPMFLQMWKQCKRDAELSNREPLLIFRRDNMQICIVFERSMYNKFGNYFGFYNYKHLTLSCYPHEDLLVMNFNEWKEWIGEGLEAFVNTQLSLKKGSNYEYNKL